MHVYETKDVERLLGVGPTALRALTRAGHVTPRKSSRGRLQFSFQDLIILRTASALAAAKIPARRLHRCLRQLRDALPENVPLSGLAITAIGEQVAVREGQRLRESDSGQYLLALQVQIEAGELSMLDRTQRQTADEDADHYTRGIELEDTDPAAALAAYRNCLAANKEHPQARLNCGRLLHLAGQLAEAERVYREARSPDATLLFNLAVLLEDLGREAEAMSLYREALALDPALADAHFNLARLHEVAGNHRDTLRHLLAYRRLLR